MTERDEQRARANEIEVYLRNFSIPTVVAEVLEVEVRRLRAGVKVLEVEVWDPRANHPAATGPIERAAVGQAAGLLAAARTEIDQLDIVLHNLERNARELCDAADAFADYHGARLAPGSFEQRLRRAVARVRGS